MAAGAEAHRTPGRVSRIAERKTCAGGLSVDMSGGGGAQALMFDFGAAHVRSAQLLPRGPEQTKPLHYRMYLIAIALDRCVLRAPVSVTRGQSISFDAGRIARFCPMMRPVRGLIRFSREKERTSGSASVINFGRGEWRF